jgi:hypothetical protein
MALTISELTKLIHCSKGYVAPTNMWIYSVYNQKRATAAKCRESHHHRTDTTTAVPFPDSGGVTHGILQRWRAYDCTHCSLEIR